ncbi:MAG TPA: flagellar biosynthetic protein FliO, partial [Gemmatimonadaceae bacterium]|nr:flagellar biosynthetic protein FliO [Gemmatimonadaceae bacterium]
MTFSSLVGIALTLALVLGLLAVTMRLLRKVSQGGTLGRSKGGVPLEVVQRIALGPRQGIAVVRIGEQLVAVSVGEGGVRTLAELEPAEATAPAVVHEPLSGVVQSPAMGGTRDFRTALMHGLRSAGLPLVIAAMTATALASQRVSAQATQRPATPAATPSTGTAAPRATPPRTQPPRGATASPATVAQPQRALGAAPAAPASQAASTSLDDALGKAIPKLDLSVDGSSPGGLRLSGSVGIVIMMGLLTLLPTLVLMMTSFTRILIVLQFLKQALGTQTAPPAQVVSALALLLTGFVMAPTMTQVNRVAITPWLDGQIEQGAMMKNALGTTLAVEKYGSA